MANSANNIVDLPEPEESESTGPTPGQLRERERSRRSREVRPSTIDVSRLTPRQRADERALYPEATFRLLPKTRGECEGGIRPCPFVSCRHNLYLDVWPNNGNIRLNFPDLEPDEMPAHASCALDIADTGGVTLETAGQYSNITRERLRQIESKALDEMRAGAGHLEDCIEDIGQPSGSALAQLQDGSGGAGVSEEDPHLVGSDDPDDRARRLANRAYARLLGRDAVAALADEGDPSLSHGQRAGLAGAAARWAVGATWSTDDQAELDVWLQNDPWASKIARAFDGLAAARADEAELIARARAHAPTKEAWSPSSESSILAIIGPPADARPHEMKRAADSAEEVEEPTFMSSVQTLLRKHTERSVQEASGAPVAVVDREPRHIDVSALHGQKRLIAEVLNDSPSASTDEIVRRTGIGVGSVHAAISKMRAWGLLPAVNRPKRAVVNHTSGLTQNQELVLEAHQSFVAEHGTEPSYSQLRDRAGLPSSGTAANVAHTLRLRGLIPPQTMPKLSERFAHLEEFLRANGPSRPHEYAEATHTPIDAARKSMCRHWRAGRLYRLDGVYSIEHLSKEEWSRIRADKLANKTADAHPKSGDRLDHIIAFIREHGPVTASDYASATQIPLGTAKDALRHHARSGRLIDSAGIYSLVEENSQPQKCALPPIAVTRPVAEGKIAMPVTVTVDPWANVHLPERQEPVRKAPIARGASDEPAHIAELRIERAKHEDVIADAKRKIEAIDEFIQKMTAA